MSTKSLKVTLKYLFYLFIFFLPLQTRYIYHLGKINGDVWEYGTRSLYLTEILLLIIISLYVIGAVYYLYKALRPNLPSGALAKIKKLCADFTKKMRQGIIENPSYILFSILFLLWAGVSILWAPNKMIAWYKWTLLLEGIIIFLFLSKITIVKKSKVIFLFIAAAAIQAGFGIYQFINQEIVANKWLGIAEHFPQTLGTSVVGTVLRRWLRAYGSLPHPNILAGFLAIALLFFIIFYSFKKKQETSFEINGKIKKITHSLKNKFLPPFIFFILITGIFLSFSRAAWLGIIITLLLIVLGNFKLIKKLFNPLSFSLLIVFASAIYFLRTPTLTRIKSNSYLEAKSNIEHSASSRQGTDIIKNNLLLGTGIGNYTVALHQKNSNLSSWDYFPVHNLFLLVWAELGAIGLSILLAFLYSLSKKFIKKISFKTLFYNYNFIILLLILFLAMFDHYFWTLYFGILLWWTSLGILANGDC